MDHQKSPCDNCGKLWHDGLLDAKPASLAGPGGILTRLFPGKRIAQLTRAADCGEDFTRHECPDCYGPGYVAARI